MRQPIALALCTAAAASGCRFIARGPDKYRDDTQALLDTRGKDVKACYDAVLRDDADAHGTVVVRFTVAEETGKIAGPALVEDGSSAPKPLRECVLRALDGLVLDPPDERDGDATFTWEFTIAPRKG